MHPLAPPGRPAWQRTNVTRGDVLAFSACEADCVALISEDGKCRVLHSANGGQAWSAPWPDIPRQLHATALLASPEGVHVGLWTRGVIRARYARDGTSTDWEDAAGAGLPFDAVITSMASSGEILFAGTQRHGLFARKKSRWRAMGSAGGSARAAEVVTSMVIVCGRLTGAAAGGLVRIHDDGGCVAIDPYATAVPIGVAALGRSGLLAWSLRSVRVSEDGGTRWFGLPDPPPDAFVRSAAGAGPGILSIMQTSQGSAVCGWRHGTDSWAPIEAGLPPATWPSTMLATATSLLLGTERRGIFRMPSHRDERLTVPMALTVDDDQELQAGTTVRFTTHRPGDVRIRLHGPDGASIRDMVLKGLPAGLHDVTIADGSIVPGIYTFTISTQGLTLSGRRIILE